MNKNCYNSRISNDADMKLGPLTKLEKINTVTSRRFQDDFTLTN